MTKLNLSYLTEHIEDKEMNRSHIWATNCKHCHHSVFSYNIEKARKVHVRD